MSDLGVEPEVIEVETGAVSAASSENKGAQVGKAKTTTKIIDHPAVLDADGTVKSFSVEAADPQPNGTTTSTAFPAAPPTICCWKTLWSTRPRRPRRSATPCRDHCGTGAFAFDGPCTHRPGLQLLHQRRARGPRQHHHGSAHGPDRLSGRRHGCWRLQGMLGHQRGWAGKGMTAAKHS